ncbi:uncharacterized protein LOC130630456 [Hydractinia symbiolongicarpus]|uniref:uncharacterized protein LOC130630048 n=1 Tax=Hydractinia symbiolongicarpus TaxID=13093 RepID=UPI00254BD9E9|nr:uncharacterized protein LOC130630048 [Hydractinia symbiolongicarpus]XP_057299942.1 uncharacterized protein LOC130630456 [Hydractinia symbiolongicarpus]
MITFGDTGAGANKNDWNENNNECKENKGCVEVTQNRLLENIASIRNDVVETEKNRENETELMDCLQPLQRTGDNSSGKTTEIFEIPDFDNESINFGVKESGVQFATQVDTAATQQYHSACFSRLLQQNTPLAQQFAEIKANNVYLQGILHQVVANQERIIGKLAILDPNNETFDNIIFTNDYDG